MARDCDIQAFEARFGKGGRRISVEAPGRVNLIGEHTDYNLGLVLPAAIDREIWIAFEPWSRPAVELTSMEFNETRSFDFEGLAPVSGRPVTWIDYVAATAWAMREAGLPLQGFRGVMDSTIPIGSGLSSSAALERASSWALAVPEAPRPGPIKMAAIAQRAENAYVGVNCGIMDQFASAAGRAGHALLIDCRINEFTATPIRAGLSIVVCDTGSPRRLDASAYNTRRAECELGVRLIAEREPGIESLRAIPWVFSWSQARIGLPAWYGLGSALEGFELAHGEGSLALISELYRDWPFLTSAFDNAELILGRAQPRIAGLFAALAGDADGARIWGAIVGEYERSIRGLAKVTGRTELLAAEPQVGRSIRLRRPYIDPLSHIQVRFLGRLRSLPADDPDRERFRRLVQLAVNGVAAGLQNTG